MPTMPADASSPSGTEPFGPPPHRSRHPPATPVLVRAVGLVRHARPIDDNRPAHDLLAPTDCAIGAGDRIALTGPSGSGKSVLMRALAWLDPIDAGRIEFEGSDVATLDPCVYRSQVAYVRQQAGLIDGSVEDNLRLPFGFPVHRNRTWNPDAIGEALAALGRQPDAFLAADSRDLSGGEAQIVALLRVLQLEPDVLLLDEPTSALDARTTAAAERLIDEWHARGNGRRALLWISHQGDQAARVATRRWTMQTGHLTVLHESRANQETAR